MPADRLISAPNPRPPRPARVALGAVAASILALACCAGLPLLAALAAGLGTAALVGIGAGAAVAIGAAIAASAVVRTRRRRRRSAAVSVELLCFDNCPNADLLLPRLRDLVLQTGVSADIAVTRIETPEAAISARFLGSPTVRIDGDDVDPEAAARSDYGLNCRLYRTDSGVQGTPPDEWLIAALDHARSRHDGEEHHRR
jgi:hypothetical protein